MYRIPRVFVSSVAKSGLVTRPASHLATKTVVEVEATPTFAAARGRNTLLLTPRLPPCAPTPLSLRFCSTHKEQTKEAEAVQPDEVISDGEKAAAEEPPTKEKVTMVNDEKATGSSTTHEVNERKKK